ncbi:MAG: sulfatase-like hydrolase/transferase, partial [Deltaproteobacteria bacterium]|nr:sulfatase-like hydrolase/transferase [Deltaproteobacteria bacterium]
YDNTLIIFTSDHGESLGEHNYFFWHGRLPYDDCLRVPFIIKFPADSKIPSKLISQPIGLIDFLPTVLDFLNLPVPKEAEGKTLMPLIRGESKIGSEYLYSEAGYEDDYQKIIRTEKWKLIYIPDKNIQKIMNGVPFELYDTENDPNELNNLIKVKDNVPDELTKELSAWMDSANIINGISSPKRVEVDKETRERLKSLGYIQ